MKFTDFIAIYGAVISTLVFLWNLKNATSRMKVVLVFGTRGSGKETRCGIYINIKNPSAHTIHLRSVNLLSPTQNTSMGDIIRFFFKYRRFTRYPNWVHTSLSLLNIETGLPKSIEARDSHMIFIPNEKIKEVLNRRNSTLLAGCAQDALWRNKYSKPYIIDYSLD